MFNLEKMKKLKLGSKELSEMLGTDQSTVWRWINGRSVPNQITRLRLIQLGLYEEQAEPVERADMIAAISEQLQQLQQALNDLRKYQDLEAALRWYVEHDETTSDDEYYWSGKRRALELLGLPHE